MPALGNYKQIVLPPIQIDAGLLQIRFNPDPAHTAYKQLSADTLFVDPPNKVVDLAALKKSFTDETGKNTVDALTFSVKDSQSYSGREGDPNTGTPVSEDLTSTNGSLFDKQVFPDDTKICRVYATLITANGIEPFFCGRINPITVERLHDGIFKAGTSDEAQPVKTLTLNVIDILSGFNDFTLQDLLNIYGGVGGPSDGFASPFAPVVSEQWFMGSVFPHLIAGAENQFLYDTSGLTVGNDLLSATIDGFIQSAAGLNDIVGGTGDWLATAFDFWMQPYDASYNGGAYKPYNIRTGSDARIPSKKVKDFCFLFNYIIGQSILIDDTPDDLPNFFGGTWKRDAKVSDLLQSLQNQFGSYFWGKLVSTGGGNYVTQLQSNTRRDNIGSIPAAWVLIEGSSKEDSRQLSKNSIILKSANDDLKLLAGTDENNAITIELPFRAHTWGGQDSARRFLPRHAWFDKKLSIIDQQKCGFITDGSGTLRSSSPNGWVGAEHLFIDYEFGATPDTFYPYAARWTGSVRAMIAGTTIKGDAFPFVANDGSIDGNDDGDGYFNCLKSAAIYYYQELIGNKIILERKYIGVLSDLGTLQDVRPGLQFTLPNYRGANRTFKVIDIESDLVKNITTVRSQEILPATIPPLKYLDGSGSTSSTNPGTSKSDGPANIDDSRFLSTAPNSSLRNINQPTTDTIIAEDIRDHSATHTANKFQSSNNDGSVVYCGIQGNVASGKLGFFTAVQNAIEIRPYGTGAGNTGEVRFGTLAASNKYAAFKASDAMTASITWTLPNADGSAGQVLKTDGSGNLSWVTMTGGVTSVGLSMPSIFSVASSPITSSGTITVTLTTESANTIFAGPSSGSAATPTFRALVAADIPTGASGYILTQPFQTASPIPPGDTVFQSNTIQPTATGVYPLIIEAFDTSVNIFDVQLSTEQSTFTVLGSGMVQVSTGLQIQPYATGIIPLFIQGFDTSSRLVSVKTSAAVEIFHILGNGIVNINNTLNFNALSSITKIGLDTGSSTDYGTAGYVLASGGSAGLLAWVPPSALTYWTESRNTASPNATVNTTALAVTGGTTDNDAAIVPKGTGALLAAIPDNTTTGGNKRGTHAVDLQTLRIGAANVASGISSVITGGQNNTNSGNYSVLSGGNSNSISDADSVISGGSGNSITDQYCAIPGGLNLTLGNSHIFGFNAGTSMTISTSAVSVFANTDLWLANNDNSARALKFWAPWNTSGAFPSTDKFAAIKAGVVTTSYTWILPLADSAGYLKSDGSGNLSIDTGTSVLTNAVILNPATDGRNDIAPTVDTVGLRFHPHNTTSKNIIEIFTPAGALTTIIDKNCSFGTLAVAGIGTQTPAVRLHIDETAGLGITYLREENAGVIADHILDSVTTTNGVATTIHQWTTANNKNYVIQGVVVGRQITNNNGNIGFGAGGVFSGSFQNIGGALVLIGQAQNFNTNIAGAAVNFVVVGANIQLQVTGIAGDSVDWNTKCFIMSVV